MKPFSTVRSEVQSSAVWAAAAAAFGFFFGCAIGTK